MRGLISKPYRAEPHVGSVQSGLAWEGGSAAGFHQAVELVIAMLFY